jgi:hypothetical protein
LAEAIVRTIPQYRLYATSLLFLYDGATQDEIDALDEESGIKYSPDVRVKIVDFAHAITDLHAPDILSAPFPPAHPNNADKGYMKGLASLKTYFKKYPPHSRFGDRFRDVADFRIWKDVKGEDDIFEGVGDRSFRTHSSTAQGPFIRSDPFWSVEEARVAKARSQMNEVAVEDTQDEQEQGDEETWSDVSV